MPAVSCSAPIRLPIYSALASSPSASSWSTLLIASKLMMSCLVQLKACKVARLHE